jgi:uncharacterized RDD family membrane protein YckC
MTATGRRPATADYPWRRTPPPPAPAGGAALARGRHAGLVSRVLASVADAVVVALLVVAGWAAVAAVRFLVHPARFVLPAPGGRVLLLVGLGVLAAYLTITWAVAGGSYGDRLLGLRVLGPRGTRLHWSRGLLRAVLCTVFPIGLFWVLLSRDNRSVQDLLLRTTVVHDG